MSFSYKIKTELCSLPKKECCRKAECLGALIFAKSFSRESIVISTEHTKFGQLIAELLAEEFGVFVERQTKLTRRSQKAESCIVSIEGDDQRNAVLSAFGYEGDERPDYIDSHTVSRHCCRKSFLRGAFLSCGTVIDPEKEYHLEITVPTLKLAEELCNVIRSEKILDIEPSHIYRSGKYVVYIKEGEKISDFLAYIGSSTGPLEIINIMQYRQIRNEVNRRYNCENANITKIANASAVQLLAIEKIKNFKGLDSLTPELRELAELRYENPEMSLRELGESLDKPISRSGVNHRLQRILEIADELPD